MAAEGKGEGEVKERDRDKVGREGDGEKWAVTRNGREGGRESKRDDEKTRFLGASLSGMGLCCSQEYVCM